MKTEILHILRKRISDSDKIKLIGELVNIDSSEFLGLNEKVKLNKEEKDKIIDKFGQKVLEEYIFKLDAYIYKTGTKYTNHYLTILNWIRRAGIKPKEVVGGFWTCSFGVQHKAGEECTCLK